MVTTQNYNQTINPLILTYCNSTYPIKALNFTSVSELSPSTQVSSTFSGSFTYSLNPLRDITKTYLYENLTASPTRTFCIIPNSTLYTNMEARFTASGYNPRYYYLINSSLSNQSSDIFLKMIDTTSGVRFTFTIMKDGLRIDNAYVTLLKKNLGTENWETLSITQTDNAGEFSEYLELDRDYGFIILKDNSVLGTIYEKSSCSASPCLKTLSIQSNVSYDYMQVFNESFAQNVLYSFNYDKDNKVVNLSFVDTTGLANYVRMQVDLLRYSNSTNTICNETLSSTAGTIVCNLTSYNGNFIASVYISRSPEKIIAKISGVISAISETIGKEFSLLIVLALVLIVGIAGAYNPILGIILLVVVMFISQSIGLLVLSPSSIVIITILGFLIAIKLNKTPI
jgi:hypothetical protein